MKISLINGEWITRNPWKTADCQKKKRFFVSFSENSLKFFFILESFVLRRSVNESERKLLFFFVFASFFFWLERNEIGENEVNWKVSIFVKHPFERICELLLKLFYKRKNEKRHHQKKWKKTRYFSKTSRSIWHEIFVKMRRNKISSSFSIKLNFQRYQLRLTRNSAIYIVVMLTIDFFLKLAFS